MTNEPCRQSKLKTIIHLLKWPLAACYDLLILFSIWVATTAVCLIFRHGQTIPAGSLWYQFILAVITICYIAGSIRRGGQTIGMKAWRLRPGSINKRK